MRSSRRWSRQPGPATSGSWWAARSTRHRGRHAGRRVGPARLQRRHVARGGGGRGRGRGVAQGPPRPARECVVRLRHRRAGRQHRCARGRPTPGAGRRPVGTSSSDGLLGGPAVRVVANVERHATIDRTLRLLGIGVGALEPVAADGQGAIDVADLARSSPADRRTDDRLPAGRQREQRRVRRSRRRDRGRARTRRMGARRRGVRPVGRGQPGDSSPCRGHRDGRLVGHRRSQVAQRAVRQRLRVLRQPRCPRRGHVVHRGLPHRARSGRRAGAIATT